MIDHETANKFYNSIRKQTNDIDEMVWDFNRGEGIDNGLFGESQGASIEGIQLDVRPKGLPWDSYNPRYFWSNDRENTTELTFRR